MLNIVVLDGITYDVDVISIDRTADMLDKYANRTEDGELHRELIGVYFNYQLKFGPGVNIDEYNRLWEKLTEAVAFHTVTVPYGNGSYTFVAYFASVKDQLMLKERQDNFFNNLSVNFIARSPARRPGG